MDGDATEEPQRSALPTLAIVVVLVVGAIVLAGMFDASRSAASLRAGDCLRAPEEAQVTQVDTVACDEVHELEVIGSVVLADGVYPGDDAIFEQGVTACEALFEDYVGEPFDVSAWFLNAFTPSREGWEAGERSATCLVFQFGPDLEYVQLTESARAGA